MPKNWRSNLRHPAETGMKSTILSIVVNAILAIIKGVAGVIGNSYALIADAIESCSDIASSLIVWFGLRISKKPADKNHPYGHGKAEPMAAVVVSLALFIAAFIIIIKGMEEIKTPHHSPAPFTLVVLILVVFTKETLFRHVFKVGNEVQSTAVKTDAWHHRSDAITSGFVFIGILIALIGGEGFESADDWAAIFAAFIIMYNAYRLLIPSINELMDAAPPKNIEKEVRKVAIKVKGVVALDKCFIRKVGFDYYVDLHVVVSPKITVKKGHKIGHDVKDAIMHSNKRICDVLIHIEPYKRLKKN